MSLNFDQHLSFARSHPNTALGLEVAVSHPAASQKVLDPQGVICFGPQIVLYFIYTFIYIEENIVLRLASKAYPTALTRHKSERPLALSRLGSKRLR